MLNSQTKDTEKKEAPPEKGSAQAPAIQLPKGGGAIRGIGEKFAANPVTGTGSRPCPSLPAQADPALARNYPFPTILALATDHSASAGVFRCPPLPVKRTRVCRNTKTLKSQTCSFSLALKIWCLCLLNKVEGGCQSPFLIERLARSLTRLNATAPALRGYSPASNAGPTRTTLQTPSGAPYPKITLPPGMVRPKKAVFLTL